MSDFNSQSNVPPDVPGVWDDPRITALIMNELSADEAKEFAAKVASNPELAAAVVEARRITDRVQNYFESQPAALLEPARREAILAVAAESGDAAPLPPATPKKSFASLLVKLAVAASVIGILIGLSVPAINSARESSLRGIAMQPADVDASAVARMEVGPEEGFDKVYSDELLRQSLDAPADTDSDRVGEIAVPLGKQEELVQSEPFTNSVTDMGKANSSNSAVVANRKLAELGEAKRRVVETSLPSAAEGVAAATAEPLVRDRRLDMAPEAGRLADYQSPPAPLSAAATEEQKFGRSIQGIRKPQLGRMPMSPVVGDFAFAPPDQGSGPGSPGDQFEPINENEFQRVAEHPLSTFSIDVDTASYSKVRDYLLRAHQLPRPDAVRIEELINYFDYDYAGPSSDSSDPFAAAMATSSCPWNESHRLVRIGIQAKTLADKERPRCNLVFLIDTSGSMQDPRKLPLVIDGMRLLVDGLRKNDRVAIVTYAGSAGLVLDSTAVKKKSEILRALQNLSAGGSTNGGAGLQLAYDTARDNFVKDGVNRVVLCSDGDFNVGMTGTDQLVTEAKRQAKSGIELTVLGFGMGNHNDAMMERISNDGAGNYAFVDSIAEARKVLADQLTGTLVTVAKDVKIQVEFNPAVVSAYRLIGYENRMLAKEDFNDDKKDAGEIGAGHRVTALYEIVPVGVAFDNIAPPVDPLKYQPSATAKEIPGNAPETASASPQSQETLTLKLRYKPPQGEVSTLMQKPLVDAGDSFERADGDFRFAAAVAGFGMKLRNSPAAGSWTLAEVLQVARSAMGSDPHGLRAEFLTMVETARSLTTRE